MREFRLNVDPRVYLVREDAISLDVNRTFKDTKWCLLSVDDASARAGFALVFGGCGRSAAPF